MIAARVATPQQLLPQLLLLLLAPPPVLVAIAGAVAALTPNRRMIAASRMRMAVPPSGISPPSLGVSWGWAGVKGSARRKAARGAG